MNLIQQIVDLPADTYLLHADVIIVRVSAHKCLVLHHGTVTTFGGHREKPRYLATRVAECVLRTRLPHPCAACDDRERMPNQSYCRQCATEYVKEGYKSGRYTYTRRKSA